MRSKHKEGKKKKEDEEDEEEDEEEEKGYHPINLGHCFIQSWLLIIVPSLACTQKALIAHRSVIFKDHDSWLEMNLYLLYPQFIFSSKLPLSTQWKENSPLHPEKFQGEPSMSASPDSPASSAPASDSQESNTSVKKKKQL